MSTDGWVIDNARVAVALVFFRDGVKHKDAGVAKIWLSTERLNESGNRNVGRPGECRQEALRQAICHGHRGLRNSLKSNWK